MKEAPNRTNAPPAYDIDLDYSGHARPRGLVLATRRNLKPKPVHGIGKAQQASAEEERGATSGGRHEAQGPATWLTPAPRESTRQYRYGTAISTIPPQSRSYAPGMCAAVCHPSALELTVSHVGDEHMARCVRDR